MTTPGVPGSRSFLVETPHAGLHNAQPTRRRPVVKFVRGDGNFGPADFPIYSVRDHAGARHARSCARTFTWDRGRCSVSAGVHPVPVPAALACENKIGACKIRNLGRDLVFPLRGLLWSPPDAAPGMASRVRPAGVRRPPIPPANHLLPPVSRGRAEPARRHNLTPAMTTTTATTVPALWPVLPARPAAQPLAAAGLTQEQGPPGMPGWMAGYTRWITDFPAHAAWLLQHARALWWPWLPLLALAVVVATVAFRVAHRAAWRRAVAGGYWLAVTPPRTVDPGSHANVWALLQPLAVRARRGWRLARPPLALEVYGDGRELRAGLWLPGWVPPDTAEDIVTRAWTGATVTATDPPTLRGPAVAGFRLAPDPWHPETGWLVHHIDPRTGSRRGGGADADLGAVFAALANPDAGTLLQVLVRPATSRRVRHLAAAGERPVKPPRDGGRLAADAVVGTIRLPFRLLFALFDWWKTPASSSSGATRREPPTAEQREAMAVARKKVAAGPHLLVSIRVGAVSDRRGDAREAAQSVGYGYAVPSWLRLARLRRPAAVLALRWAGRGGWLLVTNAELGVLAHLPADPALYGFDTAALHRAYPGSVFRARAERAGPTQPGWNRDRWTRPPATTAADHDSDPTRDRQNEEEPPQIPAPRTTPYLATDNDTDDDSDEWDDGEDPY